MIVGFPGETEAEHAESIGFARAMDFASMHVFRYSPRRGTAASRMGDQVSPERKRDRSEELRTLADEMAQGFRRRFIGRSARVLWEEELSGSLNAPNGDRLGDFPSGTAAPDVRRWTGLTDNYLRVIAAGPPDWLGTETDTLLERLAGDVIVGSCPPGGVGDAR